MNALEAFDLFVRCLETEGAQPVLAEARSLQVVVNRWFEQADSRERSSDFPRRNVTPFARHRTDSGASQDPTIRLNKREHQIVALLDEGLSNVQIASRCFLTEGTVKWYLHALFVKFDVGNRTALLRAIRTRASPSDRLHAGSA